MGQRLFSRRKNSFCPAYVPIIFAPSPTRTGDGHYNPRLKSTILYSDIELTFGIYGFKMYCGQSRRKLPISGGGSRPWLKSDFTNFKWEKTGGGNGGHYQLARFILFHRIVLLFCSCFQMILREDSLSTYTS